MSLYDRLGLSRDVDGQEIRKAYLKMSKTEHPDKGGDAERFKQIQEAYEILSDDQSRAFYDQTGQVPGQEQEQQQGMPFQFPFNMGAMGGIFGSMFGGMHKQQVRKQQKAPPKSHEIGLTLRDFFYGKRLEIKFERQKFCPQCKGQGSETFETCGQCNGSGVQETHMMIGPGMVAVNRGPCNPCNSTGKQASTPCTNCRGSKFISQEKSLSITIEPGMSPGEILKFKNECSDNHDYEEPGDVHIILREGDDTQRIVRIEDTLHVTHTINLSQGLLGSEFKLYGHPAHPDGLLVKVPIGTMKGDTITVVGEGMPLRGTTRRGNLNVSIALEVNKSELECLVKNHQVLQAIFGANA